MFLTIAKKRELEKLLKKLDESSSESKNESTTDTMLKSSMQKLVDVALNSEFVGDLQKKIKVGYDNFTRFPLYYNKEQILEAIANVADAYRDNDFFYFFEEKSNKFNGYIYNNGTEFLEDVKIQLFFASNVFVISKKIYEKPESRDV